MEERKTVPEIVEGQVISEVPVVQSGKLEFRLINPTEDGFLQTIKWNKEELKVAVRQKTASYENVVYTEDNMKQARADRAELNNLLKAIEERRKKVKKIINAPYDVFEKELKEILVLIQKQIGIIDEQMKEYEDQKKKEKEMSIRATYDEVIGDLDSVLPFERVFDNRYLNQTYKLATAQADIKSKIEKVRTDLETIDHMEGKYRLNVKDVYVRTLDISKALAENARLMELEEKLEAERAKEAAEKRRIAEEEARAKTEEKRRQVEAEARAKAEEKRRQAMAEDERQKQREAQQNISTGRQAGTLGSLQNVPVTDANMVNPCRSVLPNRANVCNPTESINSSLGRRASAPQEATEYTASFVVYGTREQIISVRDYMIANKIRFGKV